MGNLHRRLYPYGTVSDLLPVHHLRRTAGGDLRPGRGLGELAEALRCGGPVPGQGLRQGPDAFRAACTYLDGQLRGARTF